MKKYIFLLIVFTVACNKESDSIVKPVEEGKEETSLPEASIKGYPFGLPSSVDATFTINSSVRVIANNLLLGTNFGNFTSANEKELVRYLNPVSVRFPSGVWSNWYNWEKDISEYDKTDDYDIGDFHKRVMDTWARGRIYSGFPGLKSLHDELGFHMLFTYNINYDSPEKSVARLQDRESKGFDVSYIELGNEQFWKDQRSGKIATPELYYPIAKAVSEALKVVKPNVKLSVPLGWRYTQDAYNAAIAKTTDYFDAITLHKYVHYEKDETVKSAATYRSILTSGLEIEVSKNFVRTHAPGKPIWLTEWGVSCGLNAASYLGQADAYLYLYEHQQDFERAEWYGATTALNPMYIFTNEFLDKGGRPEKSVRNLKKTGHGAVYEILRDVFEDSELLASEILTRTLKTGSNAVEAKAVIKNGDLVIFAVNKTYKSIPFAIELDGKQYTGVNKHEALSYDSLMDDRLLENDENPLTLIKEGQEAIILPPFSVNKITLK